MKTISIYDSLLVLGRGIGQVMFQNNAFKGDKTKCDKLSYSA